MGINTTFMYRNNIRPMYIVGQAIQEICIIERILNLTSGLGLQYLLFFNDGHYCLKLQIWFSRVSLLLWTRGWAVCSVCIAAVYYIILKLFRYEMPIHYNGHSIIGPAGQSDFAWWYFCHYRAGSLVLLRGITAQVCNKIYYQPVCTLNSCNCILSTNNLFQLGLPGGCAAVSPPGTKWGDLASVWWRSAGDNLCHRSPPKSLVSEAGWITSTKSYF